MNKPFRFKEFTIHQDRTAMKVGTDGVLLGAWAGLDREPSEILDIGAGTGLIALMLAQRSNSERIDALEIDAQAYKQCVENFEASPWSDRLFCYYASLIDFRREVDMAYGLVVSNPPYFPETVASGNISRDSARQNQSLPYKQLLRGVNGLLAPGGIFCTIVPYNEEERLIRLANRNFLHAGRITRVRGHAGAPIKRSLLEFSRERRNIVLDELVIEISRHQYTAAYKRLTRAFYLKM